MPGILIHTLPTDEQAELPARERRTTPPERIDLAKAKVEWPPGGPWPRCDGCTEPDRPQACLPAYHPQRRPGAKFCPRCEHEWTARSDGGRACRRCTLVEYPNLQRGLF